MKVDVMSLIASVYAVDEQNAKRLKAWLTAGKWSIDEATLLFLDIDPDRASRQGGDYFETFRGRGSIPYEYLIDEEHGVRMPTGVDCDGEEVYLTTVQETLLHETGRIYKRIQRFINLHESAEPHEWIDLAVEKGITIPWLDWAIERELYLPKLKVDTTPTLGFDRTSPNHSPELALDLQAGAVVPADTQHLPVEVTGGSVAVSDALVGEIDPEPRPAARGPQFTMKKAAMVQQHQHEWPSIERDMQDASRNGLDAAKAAEREWDEAKAMEWARTRGKLIRIVKTADSLAGAMNNMATLPRLRHTPKG